MDELPDYLTPAAGGSAADPLDDYFHQIRTSALRQLPDPDATAKANGLARTFGVTPSQADANLQALDRTAQINRAATLQRDNGAIARWAEQNPRGMAAGADDYSSLSLLGKAFYGLRNIGKTLEAGAFSASSGAWGVLGGVARNAQSYSPIAWAENKLFGGSLEGVIADFAEARAREGQGMASAARPDVKNWTARNLLQGIESLPVSLASIGVGVLAGPTAGATVAGIATGGQEYLKARDKGLSPLGASVYASSQGAIEVAT